MTEEPVGELDLPLDVVSRQPSNLPLPYHMYRLAASNRPPRRAESAEPLLGIHTFLDRPVVLFNNVVQILDWPVKAPLGDNARSLESRYG